MTKLLAYDWTTLITCFEKSQKLNFLGLESCGQVVAIILFIFYPNLIWASFVTVCKSKGLQDELMFV